MSESVEAVLFRTNEELESLYEGAVEGILVVDVDTRRFVRANHAICELLGYTHAELLSLSVSDIHPAASLPKVMEAFEAMCRQGQKHARNMPCLRKDGSVVCADIAAHYLRRQPRPLVIGFFRDITEQNRTIELLRESESKLRSLFENLPDLVVTVDRGANVHFVNRGTPDISREAMLGMCALSLVAPEHHATCRGALEETFAAGEPQYIHMQDIFGHWWSVRIVSPAKDGAPEHALVICTDVTQERLATEAVNKEQRLLRQLLEMHERERRLMAYEIHDGFAQQLAGALFRLQGFREMQTRDPARAWEDFNAAVRLISRAIDETRRLISGLRPPILDESGIIEAIEYLVYEHGKQGGPKIDFMHEVAFDRLAPPLESALFRIVQESLQNACRHSGADRIRIELTQHDSRIRLDVRDWGVGFSPETVEEQRFGLQGIRERVRLLNGRAVIESAPGKGTLIAVELPLVDSTGAGAATEPTVTAD